MAVVDPKYLTQVRYRCIGPTRGGRAVAVAADPVDQNVFYFGSVAGGVWKTDDAGQYWENVSDGYFKTSSIGALAVAESDPNVIYAGTGESTIRIDVTHGDGVYKSTDAGRTWRHLGLPESRHIGALVVHPTDPDLVYVAALGHMGADNPERGVYRSADGGENWELILHVSERAGAVDLSMDPNNPRFLMATIWQTRRKFWAIESGGPDSGLWRSEDGGDNWEDISRNKGLPEGMLGKIGVAISPARSGRMWAIVEAEDRKRGLYRSDDFGNTWTMTSADPELTWRPWYYQHVIAHPTDPETVYVLDRDAWVSTDGGKEFQKFSTPHGDNHALWIDPNNTDRMVGADDGGAWVSFNGGRTWSSIYNQLTAQFYHVAVDNQYPYMVYGTQQDNSSVGVPSQTGMGAINWGDCYAAGTGESGYIAVHPDDPDIVFVGAIGSSPGGGDSLQKYDHRTKQIQLISVWPEAYADGNSAEVRFAWTYPIVFSPHDSDTLYVTGNKVFRSTDQGMSWEPISPDLTRADPETMGPSGPLTADIAGAEMYGTIFSFFESSHQKGVMMAGSDDGLVHLSMNGGADWKDVTPPDLPKFSQVTCLAESPHHDGTVYMTVIRHKMGDYAPYVYKTEDLGATWTSLSGGLPDDEFCRVIREDPARPGLLYVGTELGIHVSFDDGVNWQSLQTNLPVTPIYDFVVKDTDLVIATHGRSFWILDDLTHIHQLHDTVHGGGDVGGVHLFKPRDVVRAPDHIFAGFWGDPIGKNYHVTLGQNATFYLDEAETGHKTKRVIDAGEDRARGARITYYLESEPDGEATLTILDGEGDEVNSFSSLIPEKKDDREGLYITAEAGMNSFQWPMTYAPGEKITDSNYHGRPGGPLAEPGTYQARLTIGEESMTQSFVLVKDPRVSVGDDDLEAQFQLLMQIRNKLSEMAHAINKCRDLKDQMKRLGQRLKADDSPLSGEQADAVKAEFDTVSEKLSAIEEKLVQVNYTSEGDSLAYDPHLYEKLAQLSPVVSSADTAPTKQSYDVYEKLSTLADEQMAALQELRDSDMVQLNTDLAAQGVGAVG